MDIRGDVLEVVKDSAGRTMVRIQDGNLVTELALDDQLIEFGTAIEDGDLVRALSYLERLEHQQNKSSNGNNNSKGLWTTLARISLEADELRIAGRCYAAIGDIAKVRFLMETVRAAEEVAKTISNLIKYCTISNILFICA